MADETERLQAALAQCHRERRAAVRALRQTQNRLAGTERALVDQVDVINRLLKVNDGWERLVNPYYEETEKLPNPARNPYARGQ